MHEGLVLADRFELVRKIGQGGMGAVWEGRDTALGRRVAIKTLVVSPTAEAVRRFRGEAQIGAGLSHPGIMVVHDIGQYEQALYLVMEYLEGSDLKTLMEQGRLPLERTLEIAAELLGALGAAHAQGVVHRDVKPGNVMILDKGGLKILDFGIARFTDATLTGSVVGTPAYMAPEQFTGDTEVDGRCDLYSFGVMLYEMVVGRPPFEGGTLPEFVYAHLQKVPDPPRAARPELPESLNRLIVDLLAKDPASRPRTAEAALQRLDFVRDELRQGPARTFGPPSPRTPYARTPPPFANDLSQGPVTPPPVELPFSQPTSPAQNPAYGAAAYGPAAGWAPTQPPSYQRQPVPAQFGHGYAQQQYQQPFQQIPGARRPASYGRRAGAFVVDWFLGFVIVIMFVVAMTWNDDPDAPLSDPQGVAMLLVWAIVYFVYGMMEGLLGFSPGKGMFMLRVEDARTGERIGVARGVARVFAQIINWWSLLIGYLNPLWDAQKQTFADKVCGTRVTRA
ncbi:protein kinase domain-containing protein [Actinocorallia populi]|uniref:protein kinase domain-containing protein n=1 Tax=Actinocorallia populi TaxID=2079200 RepID=UPI000D08E7B9|nr:protein kinase [Actinocorallia populi]